MIAVNNVFLRSNTMLYRLTIPSYNVHILKSPQGACTVLGAIPGPTNICCCDCLYTKVNGQHWSY